MNNYPECNELSNFQEKNICKVVNYINLQVNKENCQLKGTFSICDYNLPSPVTYVQFVTIDNQ